MLKRFTPLLVAFSLFSGLVPFNPASRQALSVYAQAQTPRPPVERVVIRGNRIPESTIKIWIGTREGDPYDPQQLDRDVRALYAQGHFDSVRVSTEEGERGGRIVIFEVHERPLLLDIRYEGLKSVQQSTVLEEFRKRAVGLSKESKYDPVKVRRAARVIKDLLINEGYPEATVVPRTEEISPTAVVVTFKIEEGPRFRIAEIEFEGNTVYSDDRLRSQMKLIKQMGLLTAFSSKDIYHKEKLETDLDRLRVLLYADNGYLRARFGEPRVEGVGKVGSRIPIIGHKGEGLKIVIPVDEGRQYHAGEIIIEDNREFTADEIKSVIGLKPGDVVRGYSVIQHGIENLKKLYGSRGYITFEAAPDLDFRDDPANAGQGVADITFAIKEGRQYTLHRLDFNGNSFTREHVMRREVLLNEGERYNEQLWDLSILRLNQLGYFEQIDKQNATVNVNEREGLVDINLRVQEKGRQQISFTGGLSGSQGSYIGIQYSTNNLLGYGESLAFSVSTGNQQQAASFSFTEPYLMGRPISLGFQAFYQDAQFFGQGFGKEQSINDLFNAYGGQALFTQKTAGASVSASVPLSFFAKRSPMSRFTRLGLSYGYSKTDIQDPALNKDLADENDIIVPFHESGVKQSRLTPTISYNTLNGSLDPTAGKALTLGASISGGVLGGNVNTVAPYVEFKAFRPLFAGREATRSPDPRRTRTLGFRALFGHTTPFGTPFRSNSASFVGGMPLTSLYYLGGDDSIRGYDTRSIAPLVPIERTQTTRNVYAVDPEGNRVRVRNKQRGTSHTIDQSVLNRFTVTDAATADVSYVPIGGDTQLLFNFEYRIPIAGPLAFVPFADIGSAFNMGRFADQVINSEFLPTTFNEGETVTLNPRGKVATEKQIRKATTPEMPAGSLPPGFHKVYIKGETQTTTRLDLSQAYGGLFRNSRASLGGEFRMQVPVINVPFRLIFAWNPNAKVDNPYVIESRRVIRFSIGRTF